MRVRILQNHRSERGYVSEGVELDVDDEEGRRLIKGEIAEEVDAPRPKRRRVAEVTEGEGDGGAVEGH